MPANASLIAGVGTLVLAIGVGVLIGRSGDSGAAPSPTRPRRSSRWAAAKALKRADRGDPQNSAKAKGAAAKSKAKNPEKAIDSSGTSEAAAEVLKPAGDVKLPPPTVQPGGKCESGAAGCKGGEFTGEFFGE